MARDVFPQTQMTWIGQQMDLGVEGQLSVNEHLMRTYFFPLKVYYLGTNLRWLGEADDMVSGFFASRLGQEEFLSRWQASGMQLRRWLMNAFCYYLLEVRRTRQKESQVREVDEEQVTFAGDPDAAFDRASVVAIVRQAMDTASQRCDEEGLGTHWRVFLRHWIDGIKFPVIAKEFDVTAGRAAVMSRTATRKFQNALREVLGRDGIHADAIDGEIHELLESIGS